MTLITCYTCSATLATETRFCTQCGSAVGEGRTQPPAYPSYPGFGYACQTCGGDGSRLDPARVYCSYCRWLRPLGPGYEIPIESFLWRLDAEAMRVLQSLGPLTMAARQVSERFGRPWLEASVNGLRLSERQLPEIFNLAIRAGRIMNLPYLPEIYVSGDAMWDAMTLGTESSAFIVLGSVLTNFKPEELLFLLGREMGHCRAGHALWKTVMQFLSGRAQNRTIMGGGVMGLLNPTKLVENAIDAPMMAWARHSEITADRAGLLVVGKEDVARRVLQAWTFKSFPLPGKINQEAWREQEDTADESTTRFAELTLSSTPYIAGRLRLLREFAATDEVAGWRRVIDHWLPPEPTPEAGKQGQRPTGVAAGAETVRLVCVKCKEAMRVPKSTFQGGGPVNVRCPNTACRTVMTVTPKSTRPVPPGAMKPADAPSKPETPRVPDTPQATKRAEGETLRIVCPECKKPMRIPRNAIQGPDPLQVRCPNAECRTVLTISLKRAATPEAPAGPRPEAPAPPPPSPEVLAE